ncbi:MAG: glycosyltransferase [Methanobrevibacter sp.]|nr:glycosyltransferase [Methanobrevibacter sp.]
MPKVSVIIPIYNIEDYLGECLLSIINQTLNDIEIICINDGSTDNSLSILEKYAEQDKRIKIISQSNKGAAVARNEGINIAKGECLSILDGDDFYDLFMLEKMYEKLNNTNSDIVICKSRHYDMKSGRYSNIGYAVRERFINKKEKEKKVFNYKDVSGHIFDFCVGWSWDKLYKKSFVLNNNLKFQDLRSSNDLFFVFSSIVKAKRIFIVDEVLATHRRNVDTSLSKTRENDPLCFYDAISALKRELVNMNIFKGNVERSFINWSLHFCFWHLDSNKERDIIYENLTNKIFNELEFYNYPKEYFYNLRNYKRLTIMKNHSRIVKLLVLNESSKLIKLFKKIASFLKKTLSYIKKK